MLSKEIVFALSRNKIYTKIPIADSLELRSLIENEFLKILQNMFGILTSNLGISYKKMSYSLIKYYDIKDKPISFFSKDFALPKFVPNLEIINKIKEKYKTDTFSFVHSIQVFLHLIVSEKKGSPNLNSSPERPNHDALKSSSQNNEEKNSKDNKEEINNNISKNIKENPSNFEEICCYSRLIFLHIFEFLNIESKEISVLGSGLRKSDKYEEFVIILLEIMKSSVNHLYGKPICDAIKIRKISFETSPGLNNTKSLFSDDKIKEEFHLNTFLNVLENLKNEEIESLITCISRIFSFIVPSIQYPKLKSIYDYDLSQYLSILLYTQNLLHESFQAIFFSIFITWEKKEKNFSKYFFQEGKKILEKTFKNDFNIDIGIAIKLVLQMKDFHELEIFCNNDEKILTSLKQDFEKGLGLWNEVKRLLKYQEQKGVFNAELNNLFMRADELLKAKFQELKII